MPYKDLERKKEWERLHRPRRLARRRELRRTTTVPEETRPEGARNEQIGVGFLIPLVAGGTLAAYNPKLGMAVGGLTVAIAAVSKKGWRWWIVGIVLLVVALFSHFTDPNKRELRLAATN
jgi:cell division protein FtsW (lipid II flippase)